jgi:hypothetical protein
MEAHALRVEVSRRSDGWRVLVAELAGSSAAYVLGTLDRIQQHDGRSWPRHWSGDAKTAAEVSGPNCGIDTVAVVFRRTGAAVSLASCSAVCGPGDRCCVEDVVGGCLTGRAETVRDIDTVAS